MIESEKLSGALQENLLCLLCFDDVNCKMVRAGVSPQLFESAPYREIAGIAIDFIDQFNEAVKEHLPDQLEDILNGSDARKAALYKKLIDNLFLARDSINGEYVVSQLHKFVRQQTLKDAVVKVAEALSAGNIDQAEIEWQKALTNRSLSFEGGLNLSNAAEVIGILDNPEEEGFNLGIEPLDDLGIIARRKELLMFIAPRGRGKSWFITHCAKQALLQRWSVVVITLEMSEKRYASRFLQAFFSISKRDAQVKVTTLQKGNDGNLEDIIQSEITRPSLKDSDIKEVITKRANREFRRRPPIRIKEFPTRSLDIMGLRAYLDNLERFDKITPDVILIDYPDLMAVDPKNLRIELGKLIEDIRGIGVERNAATIVVSQGNREAESAKLVTGDMAAEDISKIATADTVITYSQTPEEKRLNLARLFVEKARNEESKMQVLITQAYAIGQFCLDAVRLKSDYWEFMEDKKKDQDAGASRRRVKRER